ncbi:uncharacterized protein LOC133876352 [Alnus glutinosa]|uniref:uncharacterized protein LOC133876352 n=1 Tax=Alnus glutinosa TaxID=3517 RepID=UPI002D783668|nr:uncharacterized protein LOC133876352 [Alnus glutinosa]
MPGIDPSVIVYKLNVEPSHRLVKQRIRTFAAERNQAIAEEVEKLLKAGFIWEVDYPEWLANVVLIYMDEADQEKTAFIIDRRLYCYKMMPFGLKNAGATYQGLVNKMFQGHRGIEANLEKVKAVLKMEALRTTKQLQRLTERIAARGVNEPILRGEECEEAFGKLKKYLTNPPLLSRPSEGEILYLYLAVSPSAVSSALVREDAGIQKPVYFTGEALHGVEERYPRIEKLAFALFVSARRLRPYFQAHAIRVLTEYPMKKEAKELPIELTWVVYVDGSSAWGRSGVGVLLGNPKGQEFNFAIKLDFVTTNNEAEYEAVIPGLALSREMGATNVEIRSDSQVVVGQVQGQFETQEDRMARYLDQVRQFQSYFEMVVITKIPREENI